MFHSDDMNILAQIGTCMYICTVHLVQYVIHVCVYHRLKVTATKTGKMFGKWVILLRYYDINAINSVTVTMCY